MLWRNKARLARYFQKPTNFKIAIRTAQTQVPYYNKTTLKASRQRIPVRLDRRPREIQQLHESPRLGRLLLLARATKRLKFKSVRTVTQALTGFQPQPKKFTSHRCASPRSVKAAIRENYKTRVIAYLRKRAFLIRHLMPRRRPIRRARRAVRQALLRRQRLLPVSLFTSQAGAITAARLGGQRTASQQEHVSLLEEPAAAAQDLQWGLGLRVARIDRQTRRRYRGLRGKRRRRAQRRDKKFAGRIPLRSAPVAGVISATITQSEIANQRQRQYRTAGYSALSRLFRDTFPRRAPSPENNVRRSHLARALRGIRGYKEASSVFSTYVRNYILALTKYYAAEDKRWAAVITRFFAWQMLREKWVWTRIGGRRWFKRAHAHHTRYKQHARAARRRLTRAVTAVRKGIPGAVLYVRIIRRALRRWKKTDNLTATHHIRQRALSRITAAQTKLRDEYHTDLQISSAPVIATCPRKSVARITPRRRVLTLPYLRRRLGLRQFVKVQRRSQKVSDWKLRLGYIRAAHQNYDRLRAVRGHASEDPRITPFAVGNRLDIQESRLASARSIPATTYRVAASGRQQTVLQRRLRYLRTRLSLRPSLTRTRNGEGRAVLVSSLVKAYQRPLFLVHRRNARRTVRRSSRRTILGLALHPLPSSRSANATAAAYRALQHKGGVHSRAILPTTGGRIVARKTLSSLTYQRRKRATRKLWRQLTRLAQRQHGRLPAAKRRTKRRRVLRQPQTQLLRAHRNLALRVRAAAAEYWACRNVQYVSTQPVRAVSIPLSASPGRRVNVGLTVAHSVVLGAAGAAKHHSPAKILAPSPWNLRPNFTAALKVARGLGFGDRPGDTRQARYQFAAQQRYRRERQFYRSRPRLRLPATTVTRQRRRRGGLGLFARYSLKKPQTRTGLRNLLLPPQGAYTGISRRVHVGGLLSSAVAHAQQKCDTDAPRVWVRPPSRNNRKLQFFLRREQLVDSRRVGLHLIERQQHATSRAQPLPLSESAPVRPVAARTFLRGAQPELLNTYQKAVLGVHRQALPHQMTTPRGVTPELVRSLRKVGHGRSFQPRVRAVQKRESNLWYTRSVKQMRGAERSLTAWAPQYPVKWRRWSHPRLEGYPQARSWPSHKERRNRNMLNRNLARQGRPGRRYIDYGYIHLQYHRGSAASIGYERYRRTYRGRSKHNRWWKPVKYGVPFTHPFSRRALSIRKHSLQQHTGQVPGRLDDNHTRAGIKVVSFTLKFPPRRIPWRNFDFPQPKWGGTPRVLQRWTFEGGERRQSSIENPARRPILFARPRRALRKLAALFPRTNVWAGRRWEVLDSKSAPSAESRHLFELFRAVPGSVWSALRKKAGSTTKFAIIRGGILSSFRRWGKTTLEADIHGRLFSSEQRKVALRYLAALIRAAMSANQAGSGELLAEQHMRAAAFSRKASLKRGRYWQLRELPRLRKAAPGPLGDPLARENNTLYKRWLHGAERYLRKAQQGYVPPVRNRYDRRCATDLGLHRPRFPASGRRRRTYDSVLHGFAKKTSPSRFRRVSPTKFRRIRPALSGDARQNQLTFMFGRTLRQRHAYARKLNRAAYLSTSWRELLNYRTAAALVVPTIPHTGVTPATKKTDPTTNVSEYFPRQYGQPFGSGAKRRFASLPITLAYKKTRKASRLSRDPRTGQLRVLRAALLRGALRRRRVEHTFADLKRWAHTRRLPKEILPLPWRARKLRKIRSRYSRRGDWSDRSLKTRPQRNIVWHLEHLSAHGPKIQYLQRKTLTSSYSGEVIKLPFRRVRREKRIKVGLRIRPNARGRLRRRYRDSRLRFGRMRRRKGANLIKRWRNIKHYSERKNMGSMLALSLKDRRRLLRNTARNERRHIRFIYRSRKRDNADFTPLGLLFVRRRRYEGKLAIASLAAEETTTPVTAKALVRSVPQGKPGRVRRLYQAVYCNNPSAHVINSWALAGRKFRRAQRRVKPHALPAHLARTSRYFGRRFTEQIAALSIVAPLVFQRPTKQVLKSEATKKNEFIADVSAREKRFKFTAQCVEGLTKFIPRLIAQMISKRIKDTKNAPLLYRTARHLVRNIYWSLRVYLNVDPLDVRFFLKDRNLSGRVEALDVLADRAEEQLTPQLTRAALRRRFTRGKLFRARSSKRPRADWLRAFFPVKHALWQEDPNDYSEFLVPAKDIRRLRVGNRGVASWKTANTVPSLESRSRQILTLRYSTPAPRFETMLQSTRRPFSREPAPFIKAVTEITPFFARAFSTMPQRPVAFISRWLLQRQRFVPFFDEDRPVAPYFLALGRYRVQAHVESRGKAEFVAKPTAMMLGSALDARFLRAKSPRSRQYILRLPVGAVHAPKQERITKLAAYHALRAGRAPSLQKGALWIRNRRRYFFHNYVAPAGGLQATLAGIRSAVRVRYAPATLQRRRVLATRATHTAGQYNFPNRRATEYVTHWIRMRSRHNMRHVGHYRPLRSVSQWGVSNRIVRSQGNHLQVHTARSILQARNALQRTTVIQYKTGATLPNNAAALSPYLRARLRNWKTRAKPSRRGRMRRRRLLRTWKRISKQPRTKRVVRLRKPGRVKKRIVFRRHAARAVALLFPKPPRRGTPEWYEYRRRAREESSAAWQKRYDRSVLRKAAKAAGKRYMAPKALPRKDSPFPAFARLSSALAKEYPLAVPRGHRASKRAKKLRNCMQRRARKLWKARRFAWFKKRSLRLEKKLRSLVTGRCGQSVAVTSGRQSVGIQLKYSPGAGTFVTKGAHQVYRARQRANVSARINRQGWERPFDQYRGQLWKNLTLRWMKRIRLGRNWLKETSRWFRDPWIDEIVDLEQKHHRQDKFGGELKNIEQQPGEYVPDVDTRGHDILEEKAPFRERDALKISPQPADREAERIEAMRAAGKPLHPITAHRLQISKMARKKPIPSGELAELEYAGFLKEAAVQNAKTRKEFREDALAEDKARRVRKKSGLAEEKPKRAALKFPADHWMPHIIWKEIQRRVRRLEWRESDEVFFRRGFRSAFRFHHKERKRAPWLEALMYTRATYSTRLHEFRRRQFPREQKKYKWLQRVRKSLAPCRRNKYIKWRRWPQLRTYNQKLFYSLFNLPNRRAASRHFRKLNKQSSPSVSNFVHAQKGLGTRLDITLVHLGVAPSIYWARTVAPFGLLRVNGKIRSRADDQLHPGDLIQPEWNRIRRFQHYFQPVLNARDNFQRHNRGSTGAYPASFEYHRGTRAMFYRHTPEEADLRKSSRLQGSLFRWFKLDSV